MPTVSCVPCPVHIKKATKNPVILSGGQRPESKGSEATAACGGNRELSEWQRSEDDEAAPSARKLPGTATGALRTIFAVAVCKLPRSLVYARDDIDVICIDYKGVKYV